MNGWRAAFPAHLACLDYRVARRWIALPPRNRVVWGGSLIALGVLGNLLLASCTTAPPRDIDDACAIFEQHEDWFADANAASQRWGVPCRYCWRSSTRSPRLPADARPPRTWYLGFIPGPAFPPPTATARALDGSWDDTSPRPATTAPTDQFDDAVDFIGWYVSKPRAATASPNTMSITNIWPTTKVRAVSPNAATGTNRG